MQHTPQDDTALEADPATGPAALTPAEVDEFVHQINTFEASSVSLEGRVSKGASTAAVIVAGGQHRSCRQGHPASHTVSQ